MGSEEEASGRVQATTKISTTLDIEMRRHIDKRYGTLRDLVIKSLYHYLEREELDDYLIPLAGYISTSKSRRHKSGVAPLSYQPTTKEYDAIKRGAQSFDCFINSFVEGIICQYLAETTTDFAIKP